MNTFHHEQLQDYEDARKMTPYNNSTEISMNPIIAYVTILLRASQHSAPIEVRALHDSGCAKTIMSLQTYNRLLETGHIPIQPLQDISISSCTGERSKPVGITSIYLIFEGDNGNIASFPHDVLVHETVEYDFMLGRDFTGSKYKLYETNNHLYLSNDIELIQCNNINKLLEQAKTLAIDVPIQNEYHSSFKRLLTNKETTLPPFSTAVISCSLADIDSHPILNTIEDILMFEILNIIPTPLTTYTALHPLTKVTDIQIPIHNPTNEDIVISAKSYIADIQTTSDINRIYSLDIHNDSDTLIHSSSISIQEDEGLSEEEKDKLFMEFLETGQYTPSMTGYIEKSPSVTEMSLKNTSSWSDQDFDAQFDLSHLDNTTRNTLLQVFRKYKTVFSRHEMDIGRAEGIEMEIEVDNTKPRIQKYYPLPHAVRDQTKKILDQMLEYGLLRECKEPSNFLANLLVTKKKDGSVRVLLDGRLLNQATIRKATIMTAPLEIFTSLAQKEHLTLVDVSNAFWHIPIKHEHQPFTAFYSEAHGKRFCYTRAPQGLKNSPVYLHFLMCEMFAPFVKNVIHYADDLMIATDSSLPEHIHMLEKVLERFQQYNIKLKPSKLEILKEQIEFLGIVWKKGTLNIPEARVQGFMNLAPPTTPKKSKSFICSMGYYRKFIPRYAELAHPLQEGSLVHPKQFKWSPDHQKAFDNMINAIKTHTSLNLPVPNQPFYVQTDASDVAGAGRIFQLDKNGEEKLIACVSRTFTKTERKYGVFRKEVLALLYTLKSLDFFLRFATKVIIKVDAKSILFLRLCKDSAGILLRFSVELSKYEAEIHHIPGIKNEISDMLSRQHKDIQHILDENKQLNVLSEEESEKILKRLLLPEGTKFTSEEVATLLELESLPSPSKKKRKPESKAKTGIRTIKLTPKTLGERKIKVPPTTLRRKGIILPTKTCRFKNCADNINGTVCIHSAITYKDFADVTKIIIPNQVSKPAFAKLQQEDPKFGHIYKETEMHKNFLKIDNILFKQTKHRIKPVLPTSLLDSVITTKHFSIMGLHFSRSKIKRDIESKYFLDTEALSKKLQSICSSCVQCQFNSTKQDPHLFQRTNFTIAPRASWAVDIIPSMSTTNNGNNAIFLAVDMFTGYVQLRPIKSRKTEELIQAIKDTIFIPFGLPKFIRSDNESGMQNSVEFKNFLDQLDVSFLPCSTASPWSNGAAERAVQTIKKAVKTFIQMENEIDNWDEYIHFFTQSHNSSTNCNGFTPEELHFGFSNPNNADLLQIWPQFNNTQEYMEKIIPIAQKHRETALNKAKQNLNKSITYRNKNRREKRFELGQIVLHRQLQVSTGTGGALKPAFTGPYVIDQINSDGSSATITHMHTGQSMEAHFSNMQKFEFNPSTARLPSNFDKTFENIILEKDSLHSPESSNERARLNHLNDKRLRHINAAFNYEHSDTYTNIDRQTTNDTHAQTEPIQTNRDKHIHPMQTRARKRQIEKPDHPNSND